jgi:hypothetical protein
LKVENRVWLGTGRNIPLDPHKSFCLIKSFAGSRGGFSKEPLAAGGKNKKL